MKKNAIKKIAKNRKSEEEFLNEEFDFAKAQKKAPIAKRSATTSIRWDEDVLTWLLAASHKEGISVTTKVNSLLRQVMNGDIINESRLARLEKAVFKKAP